MVEKKLYKNKAQGKVCGVCAGLSEYLNCDVTIIRIILYMNLMIFYN